MEEERKLEGIPAAESGDERSGKPLSRKKFVVGAGAAGAGIVLGSVPGVAAAKGWTAQ